MLGVWVECLALFISQVVESLVHWLFDFFIDAAVVLLHQLGPEGLVLLVVIEHFLEMLLLLHDLLGEPLLGLQELLESPG